MASDEYPTNWDSRRKEVYSRDNYTCQNCGRGGGPNGNVELHAHHIVPKSKGGTHTKSNLITVCEDCHKAIHGNSYAPSASANVRKNRDEGYFSKASTLMGDLAELQQLTGKYGMAVSNLGQNTIASPEDNQLERELRQKCFDMKAKLASFNVHNAPQKASDRFVSMMDEFISMNLEFIDELITLMNDVDRVSEMAESAGGFSCPECESTISQDDLFCSACGADLPPFGECPECGTEVDPTGSYCSSCGEKLEGWEQNTNDHQLNELKEEVENQAKIVSQISKRIGVYSQKLNAEVGIISSSSSVSDVNWDYCPNCGYEHGVYSFERRTAECILCKATWKKKGIISTKWKMVDGKYPNEAKRDEEWESYGRSMNEEREYKNHISSFEFEDIKNLQQKL